jgi:hypothetical protein
MLGILPLYTGLELSTLPDRSQVMQARLKPGVDGEEVEEG